MRSIHTDIREVLKKRIAHWDGAGHENSPLYVEAFQAIAERFNVPYVMSNDDARLIIFSAIRKLQRQESRSHEEAIRLDAWQGIHFHINGDILPVEKPSQEPHNAKGGEESC